MMTAWTALAFTVWAACRSPSGMPWTWYAGACGMAESRAARDGRHIVAIGSGRVRPGIAIDDGAAAHFTGTELHGVIAARPQAQAYRVTVQDGDVQHNALEIQYL